MARQCCKKVWEYEQDMRLIMHEERKFNVLQAEFLKRADDFKTRVKRVYKTLNVLWFSAREMAAGDKRKPLCAEVVARVSMGWFYHEVGMRRDMDGLSVLSQQAPTVPLRALLLQVLSRASTCDARLKAEVLWDTDCFDKLKDAFKEIVPRVMRLLESDSMLRYYVFFDAAIKHLQQEEHSLGAFFRDTMGGRPEDFAVEDLSPGRAKAPHEIAFGGVALLVSSGFLDRVRPAPEVMDLSTGRPEAMDLSTGRPEAMDLSAGRPEVLDLSAGRTEAGRADVKPDVASFEELPPLFQASVGEPPDNIALAIERVVAKFSRLDEPECVDLTSSPSPSPPPPAPKSPIRRRRPPAANRPRPTSTAPSRRPATAASKAKDAAVQTTSPPVILASKRSASAPRPTPSLVTLDADPPVATPSAHDDAQTPTASDQAAISAHAHQVLRPTAQRFLYLRTQPKSTDAAERAADQLRLGFGSGEAVQNGSGRLFERFHQPDGRNAHQVSQLQTLLEEHPGLGHPDGVVNVCGRSCVSRAGRCSGHLVPVGQRRGAVQNDARSSKAGEGNESACRGDNGMAAKKALEIDDKPGKVVQSNILKIDDMVGKLVQPKFLKIDDMVGKMVQSKILKIDDKSVKVVEPKILKIDDKPDKVVGSKILKLDEKTGELVEPKVLKRDDKTGKLNEPFGAGEVIHPFVKPIADNFARFKTPSTRRRFVANGRRPFKEILPMPPKTNDRQPAEISNDQIFKKPLSRMAPGGLRFVPYKLELQMTGSDSASPKMLGKAVTSVPVTFVREPATVVKKYDFRSRAREVQDGQQSGGKPEDQWFFESTVRVRDFAREPK